MATSVALMTGEAPAAISSATPFSSASSSFQSGRPCGTPDASEAERPDGVELGEELREDVFTRVDRGVGRIVRMAWCFGTLD